MEILWWIWAVLVLSAFNGVMSTSAFLSRSECFFTGAFRVHKSANVHVSSHIHTCRSDSALQNKQLLALFSLYVKFGVNAFLPVDFRLEGNRGWWLGHMYHVFYASSQLSRFQTSFLQPLFPASFSFWHFHEMAAAQHGGHDLLKVSLRSIHSHPPQLCPHQHGGLTV